MLLEVQEVRVAKFFEGRVNCERSELIFVGASMWSEVRKFEGATQILIFVTIKLEIYIYNERRGSGIFGTMRRTMLATCARAESDYRVVGICNYNHAKIKQKCN